MMKVRVDYDTLDAMKAYAVTVHNEDWTEYEDTEEIIVTVDETEYNEFYMAYNELYDED
jgi:hypothetical protein